LKNDWAFEDLAIQDASKRSAEAVAKLREIQLLYEQVKNERNKYVLFIYYRSTKFNHHLKGLLK
jgi:tryptophan synthase alpha subunit